MARKRKQRKQQAGWTDRGSAFRLDRAYALIGKKQWEEATELLNDFLRKKPNDLDALNLLGMVYQEQRDFRRLWDVTHRLLDLQPDQPYIWANATQVAMANNLPFSARYYVGHFLSTWPDHEQAPDLRKAQQEIEAVCAEIEATDDVAAGAATEDLIAFEMAQMLLSLGRYQEGRAISQQAIQKLPHLAAPLNNLSLSYALEGEFDEAIQIARQVLEQHPDNIHALSNLTQFLVRAGQREEAKRTASRLLEQTPTDGVGWTKQIEAFAYLGDDATVCELYDRPDRSGVAQNTPPFLYHLAAVSFARQGSPDRARQLWQKTLKLDRHFQPAQENLDDLKKPVGERHGAWPFALPQWVPVAWIERVASVVMKHNEAAIRRDLKRLLQENPALNAVIPILLERGDPQGREFALHLAEWTGSPALREFALGQHGPDQLRLRAANIAVDSGLLPRGQSVPLYMKGEQQEMMLLAYEIHTEVQPHSLPKRARQLHIRAHEAVQMGRLTEALEMVEEALGIAPDAPVLLNLKAATLGLMGRKEETHATIRRMAELHPDYPFARCHMAELCAAEGKLEEAYQWLDPVRQRPRLHISEFGALCKANIEVLLAEGLIEGAKSWLGFWEQTDPDSPYLPYLRRRLRQRKFGLR